MIVNCQQRLVNKWDAVVPNAATAIVAPLLVILPEIALLKALTTMYHNRVDALVDATNVAKLVILPVIVHMLMNPIVVIVVENQVILRVIVHCRMIVKTKMTHVLATIAKKLDT